jgi:hypothetical protein
MKTFNHSLLMLTSVVLVASCTGQIPPITPTTVATTPTGVANTLATSESSPLVTTPQMTEVPATATATSRSEQNPSPTTAAGVDVSSPVAFIADTGVLPTPTVSKKKDKFENFSVPVSGESAFSLLPLTGFPKDILSVIEPQPADKKYSTTDVTVEIPSRA